MIEAENKRLFVPLSSKPFDWFASGAKRWELRKYGRQYTERHLTPGRRVELRRGYGSGTPSLWGTIADVRQAPSLTEFFHKVPYREIVPGATSFEDAVRVVEAILGLDSGAPVRVIGFKIEIHP